MTPSGRLGEVANGRSVAPSLQNLYWLTDRFGESCLTGMVLRWRDGKRAREEGEAAAAHILNSKLFITDLVRHLLSKPGGSAGCQCARRRTNATSSAGGRPFCTYPSNSSPVSW